MTEGYSRRDGRSARAKLPETPASCRASCLVSAALRADAESMRRAVLLLATVLAAVGAPAAHAGGTSAAERSLLAHVNEVRDEHGCGPLALDAGLARAAGAQAEVLLAQGLLDHDAGTPFADRMGRAAPGARLVGETLAFTSGRRAAPAWIVQRWLDSPPHRRILLDCRFDELGVGIAGGRFGERGDGTVYVADLAA
jgi:uncharacterized protein YkwD